MNDYQIDTDNILARHRQLGGLKTLATSAPKLTSRSFELYGPTMLGEFGKWLGRSGNLGGKQQFIQVVQAHQQLIVDHGVYGWLQVLLTGAVFQYQRDLNMAGRRADATYISRAHVDDVCRLGTHVLLNYGAPTHGNRVVLAHFLSGNYAVLVDRVLPEVTELLQAAPSAERLELGANPLFRVPLEALEFSVVHELDLRPRDVDEPVGDEGFSYRPAEMVEANVTTLAGATQQMVAELTMIVRVLQTGLGQPPWDDAAVVGARLESIMGVAWASQCLDPNPEVASDEHRQMYVEDLIERVEKLQNGGLIGTVSSDIFETRKLVEQAADGEPSTVMLYDRALRQSVDNAAWVLFNWVPDVQQAGFLAQLLLNYQFDAFFAEVEQY